MLHVALWSTQESQTGSYWLGIRGGRAETCFPQQRRARSQRECARCAWGSPQVKAREAQFRVQCTSHGAWNKDKAPLQWPLKWMENERKMGDCGERPGRFPGVLSWAVRTVTLGRSGVPVCALLLVRHAVSLSGSRYSSVPRKRLPSQQGDFALWCCPSALAGSPSLWGQRGLPLKRTSQS